MNRPKVGVGVLTLNTSRKLLLGKRKNAHGAETWSPPGGHLEFNEGILTCAYRELVEETGLTAKEGEVFTFTNDVFEEEGLHYITIWTRCQVETGEPVVMEPHKCEEWRWFEWGELPEKLFLPLRNLLKRESLFAS